MSISGSSFCQTLASLILLLAMIRLSSFICLMRLTQRVEPGRSVGQFIRVYVHLIHAPALAEAIWSSLYSMRLSTARKHNRAEARAPCSALGLQTLSTDSASATSRSARDPCSITSIRPQHGRSSRFAEKFCGQGSARQQGYSAPRTRGV